MQCGSSYKIYCLDEVEELSGFLKQTGNSVYLKEVVLNTISTYEVEPSKRNISRTFDVNQLDETCIKKIKGRRHSRKPRKGFSLFIQLAITLLHFV